jgi:hypothetical protein
MANRISATDVSATEANKVDASGVMAEVQDESLPLTPVCDPRSQQCFDAFDLLRANGFDFYLHNERSGYAATSSSRRLARFVGTRGWSSRRLWKAYSGDEYLSRAPQLASITLEAGVSNPNDGPFFRWRCCPRETLCLCI